MRTNLHKESQEGCNDLGQSCRHPGGEEVLVMMLEHAIYLQRVVTSNDGCSVTPHSEPTLVVPWLENSKKCSSNSICVGVLQLSCDRFFADFLAKTTEILDDLNMSHEEKRWYFCFMFHPCFKQSNMLFKKCVNCEHDLCSEIGPTVTNLLKLVFHLPTFALMHLRFIMSRSFWQNWGLGVASLCMVLVLEGFGPGNIGRLNFLWKIYPRISLLLRCCFESILNKFSLLPLVSDLDEIWWRLPKPWFTVQK